MARPPHHSRRARRLGLPRLSFYVLGQLLGPVALCIFLLTSVAWMVQMPSLLDLVINRGQSAFTFLHLILLLLPTLLLIIMPIAYFTGTLYALQRLSGDSELVVMAASGFSRRQLSVPVLLAAALVMALTYLCSLYLMPLGQRELNARKADLRADIGAALLSEGQFNNDVKGLTVFIRHIGDNGDIGGILVHDSRDLRHPVTYIAQRGELAQTPAGARLIMYDATVQQSEDRGARLNVLSFRRYTLPLDQFAAQTRATVRRANERFLDELLWPGDEPGLTPRVRRTFLVEAHNRLTQPLYCIAFGLIALAAVTRGRRQRGPRTLRLGLAALAAAGLWLAGYGVAGAAQSQPLLIAAFYLIPLIGVAGAILVLAGYSPAAILARRRSLPPEALAA